MRKRKYTTLDDVGVSLDVLLEEVDDYYTTELNKIKCVNIHPVLEIHNLVGTAKVLSSSGELDLDSMSVLIPNCTYNRQKFAAITIRLHYPACTALLFTSGKMVLTGCKTYIECISCALQVVSLLKNSLRATHFTLCSVYVQNMVGNVSLNLAEGKCINLKKMQDENRIFCTYQKKMFPGLIYRPEKSPIVLLLFTSGKIVVTGGKSVSDMQEGWKILWEFVYKYIT